MGGACGQTKDDPRPNKDLHELVVPPDTDVRGAYDQWNEVVCHGVIPSWSSAKPQVQSIRPSNHKSVNDHALQVRHHIRNGPFDGRYLIVEDTLLSLWSEIFINPSGVADKKSPDGNDICVVNDYSYPEGNSVNDWTHRDKFPVIYYNPPRDIALRIHKLRQQHPNDTILMMLGDVSGAFRHVPVHADAVHMFAFRFDGFVVIDLRCDFG